VKRLYNAHKESSLIEAQYHSGPDLVTGAHEPAVHNLKRQGAKRVRVLVKKIQMLFQPL